MSHEETETVELPNGMWAVIPHKGPRRGKVIGGPFKTLGQANAWAQWRSNPKSKNVGERPPHKKKGKEWSYADTFEHGVKRNLEKKVTRKRGYAADFTQEERDALAQEQRRLMAARMVLASPAKGTALAGVGGTINEGNKARRELFTIPGIEPPHGERRSKPSMKNLKSWFEGILDAWVAIEDIEKKRKLNKRKEEPENFKTRRVWRGLRND